MVNQWKKEILANAGTLFEGKRGSKVELEHEKEDRLFGEIGRLKMELDWLKKVRPVSGAVRLGWIMPNLELPLSRQCELAGVSRTTVYRPRVAAPVDEDDLTLCALIDEEYTEHPFYGSRRMFVIRLRQGWLVGPQAGAAPDAGDGLGGDARKLVAIRLPSKKRYAQP